MQERETARKIAFVGTMSTWKTRMFEHYRRKFSGDPTVAFVEEAARRYFTDNPHIVNRFAKEPQGEIQQLALGDEKEAHESGARIIVCDRAVIDAVGYVRADGDKEGSEELLKRVEFWLPTYHKFLLLDPAGVPFVADEVREEDEEKQRQHFHNVFMNLFEEKQIPYELVSGSFEERIGRIDEILSEG